METTRKYRDYATYLRKVFGERVQKISIETGYSCPNRDGDKGIGGCTYCNLDSIRPSYIKNTPSITAQLEKGTEFFRQRNKTGKFLAYFQTYTNTYTDLLTLQNDYEEALRFPGVVGIVIGTRPDCILPELADFLESLAARYYVSVELGIESTDEETLLRINRCHTFENTVSALALLANRNIHLGGHLILGFPWENKDTMLSHAQTLSLLPLDSLKLHHLQILNYTQLAKEHRQTPFSFMQPEEYLQLIIQFLERSNPTVVFQRFITEAPRHLLIAPQWGGIKNHQFMQQVNQKMIELNTEQGALFLAKELAQPPACSADILLPA